MILNQLTVLGKIAPGLPPVKIPPLQTTIGNQTLYFTDMIVHLGSSVFALPLVSILETIAVTKAISEFQVICHAIIHTNLNVHSIFSTSAFL